MKDRFSKAYDQIITECNSHTISEGFFGTLKNKVAQGLHTINHLGKASAKADNAAANKERFNTLFVGSGWEQVEDFKWRKKIEGKIVKVKYDTGVKKIFIYIDGKFSGKLPLSPAADEDAIQKALNKLQSNNSSIPALADALKPKEQQEKDKAKADADSREAEEDKDDPEPGNAQP